MSRGQRRLAFLGPDGAVDVAVTVPTGSDVEVVTSAGALHAAGRLGRTRVTLGMGPIRLDGTGPLTAVTGMGDVTVERVDGPAEVRSGTGTVRVEEVAGSAAVKNANGPTWLGWVAGAVRVTASNGVVSVDRADGDVQVRSAAGDVRVLDVVRGAVHARTAAGAIEIGVREGTAAWLDVTTGHGRVRTDLEGADAPGAASETVEVRAHTGYGDVVVRRA